MGGGTGTFPVVSAWKHFDVEIDSIIAVSDSGGSSGRIRDEFGFQPVGDLRQALAALAENEGEEWIRKILLYRFSKGTGLLGHNLGNLILTALQDMTGDTSEALAIAQKVFRLEGRVIPVTQNIVDLEVTYEDGSVIVGEHTLDAENILEPKKITHIALIPEAEINPLAAQVIIDADVIVIGPGDYYASLMSTLIPKGTAAAFAQSHAKIIYICNLMTRLTQTHNMTGQDHLYGIEKILQKKVDGILFNNHTPTQEVLSAYASEREFPVVDDLGSDPRVIRADIIADVIVEKKENDTAHRSLLRHDKQKLQEVLRRFL